jgi:hypothetical protein
MGSSEKDATYRSGRDGVGWVATLENVVAGIVETFHRADDEGFLGLDLAVRDDGQVVAVVRKGTDGNPVATIL